MTTEWSTLSATGSDISSELVRVRAEPNYIEAHSNTIKGRWVFEYVIRIDNTSARPLTLLSREWLIIDGEGERHSVVGEGVVGQQPRIEPGDHFEYASFCPLPTHWGTMEGAYQLIDDDGLEHVATVGRFFLVS
jgi:ApaG protein